ncbi:MAG TPA: LPP20 family lipoprotein [Cyclobacteriaceae bacterium]
MKVLPLILILWPFLICGQSKGGPDWVYKTPNENGYYFGVGVANIKGNIDYRLAARKRALREIAESLMVEVQSTSNLRVDYAQHATEYTLNEEIVLSSDILLNDCEMLDDWVDRKKDNYYVLIRLNFWQYEQDRNEAFMQVMDLAQQNADLATKWFLNGQYQQGFLFLNDAISMLREENSFFEPDIINKLEIRIAEYSRILRERLLRLSISVNTSRVFWDYRSNSHDPITIELKDSFTNQNITGFDFEVISLVGDVFDYRILEKDDRYRMMVNGALPEDGKIEFYLIPKVAFFTKALNIAPHVFGTVKSNTILMEIDDLPMSISFDEKVFGQKEKNGPYQKFISNFLTLCAMRIAREREEPLYELVVDFEIVKHEIRNDHMVALSDGKMTLYSTSGEKKLKASFQLPPSKGYGKNWKAAANNSFTSLTNRIDNLLQDFVAALRTL